MPETYEHHIGYHPLSKVHFIHTALRE